MLHGHMTEMRLKVVREQIIGKKQHDSKNHDSKMTQTQTMNQCVDTLATLRISH